MYTSLVNVQPLSELYWSSYIFGYLSHPPSRRSVGSCWVKTFGKILWNWQVHLLYCASNSLISGFSGFLQYFSRLWRILVNYSRCVSIPILLTTQVDLLKTCKQTSVGCMYFTSRRRPRFLGL